MFCLIPLFFWRLQDGRSDNRCRFMISVSQNKGDNDYILAKYNCHLQVFSLTGVQYISRCLVKSCPTSHQFDEDGGANLLCNLCVHVDCCSFPSD